MEQTIGMRIMSHRKRLGLTQDQLAEKLGVTAQAVSKWENNQSCPDISMIPKIADIFNISTDELLGHENSSQVFEGEVVNEAAPDNNRKNIEISVNSGRKNAIGVAVFVLLVGALYLCSTASVWDISLWSILWPAALLIFGIWGLYPRFSFFRTGCMLVGGYYLFVNFLPNAFHFSRKFILAVIILLFGISLLVDAMKHTRKPSVHFNMPGTDHNTKRNYTVSGTTFNFSSSFGSIQQEITLDLLSRGTVSTSFGEFSLNLAGVNGLAPNAVLEIQNSFGELTVLVPRKYKVISDHSTAFASFKIQGQPDSVSTAELFIKSSVSFGETIIQYI